MYTNQNELIDTYMDATIINCHIQRKASNVMEIIVTYDDGYTERIWSYNPTKYTFDYHKFIGRKLGVAIESQQGRRDLT